MKRVVRTAVTCGLALAMLLSAGPATGAAPVRQLSQPGPVCGGCF